VPYLLLAEYVRIAPTRCDIEQKFERIALGVILVCLWIVPSYLATNPPKWRTVSATHF
jgi:hypothetical protein